MNIVEFDRIHRAYQKGIDVLDGVSFTVAPGEVVGLLGKNGAGKTTLLRIAMGMLAAQKGSVRLFGMDPREHPLAVKRRTGYVSEDQILPAFLKVSEVIDLHRDLFPTWDDAMAKSLAERFELSGRAKVGKLSKGQARQVALLCAVSHRPELLILDEPAGGLDPAARREFLEASIQLLNEAGSTILFSSHHMADVERMAERVVMIHKGRILLDHALDQLREGHCLALIPHSDPERPGQLRAHAACLGVRRRSDAWHAIFRADAASCPDLLARELGIRDVRCTTVDLEEMFVELVGGES